MTLISYLLWRSTLRGEALTAVAQDADRAGYRWRKPIWRYYRDHIG